MIQATIHDARTVDIDDNRSGLRMVSLQRVQITFDVVSEVAVPVTQEVLAKLNDILQRPVVPPSLFDIGSKMGVREDG